MFCQRFSRFSNYLLQVSLNQRTAIISFVAQVPIKSVRFFFAMLKCTLRRKRGGGINRSAPAWWWIVCGCVQMFSLYDIFLGTCSTLNKRNRGHACHALFSDLNRKKFEPSRVLLYLRKLRTDAT